MALAADPCLEVAHEDGRWLLLGAGRFCWWPESKTMGHLWKESGLHCNFCSFQGAFYKEPGIYCANVLMNFPLRKKTVTFASDIQAPALPIKVIIDLKAGEINFIGSSLTECSVVPTTLPSGPVHTPATRSMGCVPFCSPPESQHQPKRFRDFCSASVGEKRSMGAREQCL